MSSWDCLNCGLTNSASKRQCLACFTPNTFERNRCNYRPIKFDLDLLISGYIREIENKIALTGIIKIIETLYPSLMFKFGAHDEAKMNVSENGTILKGCARECEGFIVYADLGIYIPTNCKILHSVL